MDEMQTMLDKAIKDLNIEDARMYIVDNDIEPREVDEEAMLVFIQKAIKFNHKPLLKRLFKYDKKLNGKILWSMLDNITVATMLVNAGTDLSIQRMDSLMPTFLHVLAESNDQHKLQLAELMIDKGANVSAVDNDGRSVLQYAIRGGAPINFIRKLIWNSVLDLAKNAVAIADSERRAELTPALISLITKSIDEDTKYRRIKDTVYKLIEDSSERIPESRQAMIADLLEHTETGDILDCRGNSVRDKLKPNEPFENILTHVIPGAGGNSVPDKMKLTATYEENCEMNESEKQLTDAIKTLDMELASILMESARVDKYRKPKGVNEEEMLTFIQNAALVKDESLFEQLCRYDSVTLGEILWITLKNYELARTIVLAGADLSVRKAYFKKATFLHVLSSDDPNEIMLAELMINHGAEVSAVDDNGRSVLQYAIQCGAPVDFIRKLIRKSEVDFSKNAVAIADSDRKAELTPVLISFITDDSIDQAKRNQMAKAAILELVNNSSEPIPESRKAMIANFLEYTETGDILDSRGNSVRDKLKPNNSYEDIWTNIIYDSGCNSVPDEMKLTAAYIEPCELNEKEKQLADAIKTLDIELASKLMEEARVEKYTKPKGVNAKEMMIFIQKAAVMKDEPLLEKLRQYDSVTLGEILWTALKNYELAAMIVHAGADLTVRPADFTKSTFLHVLSTNDPNELKLAELMIDNGAEVSAVDGIGQSVLQSAIQCDAPVDFIHKLIRKSEVDFPKNAVTIADSNRKAELTPVLISFITDDSIDQPKRNQMAKAAIWEMVDKSFERIPESRQSVIKALENVVIDDKFDPRVNSVRDTLKPKEKYEEPYEVDVMETELATAMENLDMEYGRALIVKKNIKPRRVGEEDMMSFIQNAALMNDELLLERLCQYDSTLNGRLLWNVLDNIDVAKMFVRAGADLTVPRDAYTGVTFLHELSTSNDRKKLELAELMIDHGADVSALVDNKSVLQCAISAGAPNEFIEKLVSGIADDKILKLLPSFMKDCPEIKRRSKKRVEDTILTLLGDQYESTPESFWVAIKALLKHTTPDYSIDYPDKSILENLMLNLMLNLVSNRDVEEAKCLFEGGENPNAVTGGQGWSYLWIASALKDSSLATFLIKKGADVNFCNTKDGQRPIHGAFRGHSLMNVFLLIRLGVDINVTDNQGITPLQCLQNQEEDSSDKRLLYKFFTRHLALVNFPNTRSCIGDIKIIENLGTRNVYISCINELLRMEAFESNKGTFYYSFLVESVEKTSNYTTEDHIKNICENQTKLKGLLPYYFCDLRNAYVFAKERQGLITARKKCLFDIAFEVYQIKLSDKVIDKIINYSFLDELQNLMLDAYMLSCPKFIWE